MASYLDLPRFYRACSPSRPLNFEESTDRPYYIDFGLVRGGSLVETFARTITRLSPEQPTHQVFSGHIGCGKTTELLRLKVGLEREGFHVVYFESSQYLEMGDVDISDILLAIAYKTTESMESIKIKLKSNYFTEVFAELKEFLSIGIELSDEADLSVVLGEIAAKIRHSPKLRSQLRQYLEPRTYSILQALNQEIIRCANHELKLLGKKGLVILVDNLDRIDAQPLQSGRLHTEYLFIDRGEQLRRLNCHTVYTIPLSLIFSSEYESLKNQWTDGLDINVLSLVPVQLRDGSPCQEGMEMLRQMVLARAFPDIAPEQRLGLITEVFDCPETLERLCKVSGGHVRNLLGLLSNCLHREDPPFSGSCLENVIKELRDRLCWDLTDNDWSLLRQVMQQQSVQGKREYQSLLKSFFVFEYQNLQERWCSVNPLIAEIKLLETELHKVDSQIEQLDREPGKEQGTHPEVSSHTSLYPELPSSETQPQQQPIQKVSSKSSVKRDQVFISYSHKDNKWLDKLQTMLKPMIRNNSISVWADTAIKPGSKWRDEIEKALAAANVAVLMVSPNFIASDFIANHELPPLLNAAEQEGLKIIWVPVDYCLYEETEIEQYQAAHNPSQPLENLNRANINKVLVKICKEIKAATESPTQP